MPKTRCHLPVLIRYLFISPRPSAFRQDKETTLAFARQDGQVMEGTALPSTTACCPLEQGAMKMPSAYMLGRVRYVLLHALPLSALDLTHCSAGASYPVFLPRFSFPSQSQGYSTQCTLPKAVSFSTYPSVLSLPCGGVLASYTF